MKVTFEIFEEVDSDRFPIRSDEESPSWNGEYGYSILIDHGNGFQTRYAHCSKLLVSVGTSVSKGQRIALMGDTGRATGSHLHFEVILNGSTQNPVNYIG